MRLQAAKCNPLFPQAVATSARFGERAAPTLDTLLLFWKAAKPLSATQAKPDAYPGGAPYRRSLPAIPAASRLATAPSKAASQ